MSRLLSLDGSRADTLGAMSLRTKGCSYALLWAMLFKTLGDTAAGQEVEEQGVCPHGTVCEAPEQQDVLLLQKQVKVEGHLAERQASTALPAEWRGFTAAFLHRGTGRDPIWAVDKVASTWFGCHDCMWAGDLGSMQEISEVEIAWGGCES